MKNWAWCVWFAVGLSQVSQPVLAQTKQATWYDHVAVQGVFRVFYAVQGEHAIPAEDGDANGVPDRVDDVLVQLAAADWLFNTQLGLVPPLQQPRYARAKAIDVQIKRFEKGNGLAFDELSAAKPPTLVMRIGAHVDAKNNVTPAHELFHLYQYGYTSFKTKWFTEGMARWMEKPFTRRANFGHPPAPASCQDLAGMAYNASGFFEQLAVRQAPPAPGQARLVDVPNFVYSDGSPAIRDRAVHKFLPARLWLDRAATLVAQEAERLGLPHGTWPEDLQRNPQFDRPLCEALTKP
ncbi:MAG TPA: hypothetical protein VFV39_01980 [Limnobacter sp.]|nr:hypothetical protein [Limnobacter sp.]